MLDTNKTNANNFIISQAVTELVANSILNEGLTLLKVESIKVDERMSERNIFIYGIDKFTVFQAYTDNSVAATGFLDSLYEQLSHETVAEFYIYENVLFTSLNDLIEFYLANKQN